MIPSRDGAVFCPFVNPLRVGLQARAESLQIIGQAGAGRPQVDKIAYAGDGFHDLSIREEFSSRQSRIKMRWKFFLFYVY